MIGDMHLGLSMQMRMVMMMMMLLLFPTLSPAVLMPTHWRCASLPSLPGTPPAVFSLGPKHTSSHWQAHSTRPARRSPYLWPLHVDLWPNSV